MATTTSLPVQIGHDRLDATTPALEAAIDSANASARIADLPDALNPGIIDPAKARALVNAVAPTAAVTLGGKALLLSPALLRIGTSSPTTVQSFATPVTLQIVDTHGHAVSARATVKVDCALATRQAAAARSAFAKAEQAKRQQESTHPSDHQGLVALSTARSRVFAIATVWKENAAAALDCAPSDPGVRRDLDAASRAVSDNVQAPQDGMPSD